MSAASTGIRTREVTQEAHRLGFQKVGVARAERCDGEAVHLREWLLKGYQASMAWMAETEERRADPRKVLPGARSVISVAMNYYVPERHSSDPGHGQISRYAWGDDYHGVLAPRLQKLLDFITERVPGVQGRIYVDTGPVMEKAWAQRAGIGWQGKHTNLITQEYGSWVFLGEIMLDVELEEDAPETDHCGECTLCLEACPTGALPAPYILDANLCISYMTIEHRGNLPQALAGKFDRWVFGCDICQDVCPWNAKFARETTEGGFQPRPGNIAPRLEELTTISREDFQANFKNSAVKRAHLEGIQRNANYILSSKGAP
jgi:epoxyqueuosine reductase